MRASELLSRQQQVSSLPTICWPIIEGDCIVLVLRGLESEEAGFQSKTNRWKSSSRSYCCLAMMCGTMSRFNSDRSLMYVLLQMQSRRQMKEAPKVSNDVWWPPSSAKLSSSLSRACLAKGPSLPSPAQIVVLDSKTSDRSDIGEELWRSNKGKSDFELTLPATPRDQSIELSFGFPR